MPPRLAIVSTNTRRDLQDPLKFFSRLDVLHFYRRAEYDDLTQDDWSQELHHYGSPGELESDLVGAHPDIIQGVEPFAVSSLPYLWACYSAVRRTRARLLIVTPENCPIESKYGRVMAFGLSTLLRPYFARAGLVIVLNRGARANLARVGVPPPRVEQILWGSWGVDTNEFSPREKTLTGMTSETAAPVLLFVGRLHFEKGVFVLLDAFAQVQRTVPNMQLWMIGNGPARVELEARAAKMEGVTFSGTIKNRLLPDYFRQASVFVSPSLTTRRWQEQIGMTNLQAMACGIPIVTTRSGAIPEYVPDGVAGILVQEGNPHALADAILSLFNDFRSAQEMGRRGREYALEHYEVRANVQRAEQLMLDWLQ